MKRFALLTLLFAPATVGFSLQAVAEEPLPRVAGYAASPSDTVLPPLVDDAECFEYAPPSQAGWFGDIGFYVLTPQWTNNPAFQVVEEPALGAVAEGEQIDFDHDADFAPLVSVGYSGDKGLGARVRWWTLGSGTRVSDSTDDPTTDILLQTPSLLGAGGSFAGAPGVGETLSAGATHRLDLDVIDLEGIWDTELGRTSLLFSAGIRYAHLGQRYDATIAVSDTATGTVLDSASFQARNTFNGAGPTTSLQAYRQIGQTQLAIYGLGRGSLLFGERRQRAANLNPAGPLGEFSNEIINDGVMPVVELEVGANWTRRMGCYDLFVEGGLVGQAWFNAGNAANSDSLGFDIIGIGTGMGATGSNDAEQTMGLVGLKFTSGVRF
ncbi:Lpg1974 family pore-forming outer membrane protein [Candidatus Laterigemmans baculatus]|uniref:Lpg1974 family pore-forming outer membrane protein n=1 Tax=Candidatus Laterigemmans baculatus TaxID=2770505 RepID=UPI0013D8EDDF|nr:Lpg1974 family pore-forming outer membrane protein [Candidatus Laterigemmans baculatus]